MPGPITPPQVLVPGLVLGGVVWGLSELLAWGGWPAAALGPWVSLGAGLVLSWVGTLRAHGNAVRRFEKGHRGPRLGPDDPRSEPED